ncbi:MAG: hypothetical protein JSU01_09835 [Bacteroidetes bacterium]|nr:hypothetical protein [Bacteroidota bacterium]
MKIKYLLFFSLLCFGYRSGICQGNVHADPLVGTWKGSSLCQVKDSPCHDEAAVYHATKLTPTTYRFQMNKMVDGKEVEMGPLVFTWNEKLKTLTGTNKSSRGTGIWLFHLDGSKMHGTLTIDGGTLFRVIELQKE